MRSSRFYGGLAAAGIAVAAALVVDGHVDPSSDLDPWSLTISDFAVSDRGGVIDVAMVVTALATVVTLAGLHAAGVRLRGWPVLLFSLWAGGLVLAAIVPTSEPGLPLNGAAYVHRYASVMAFAALPLAALTLSVRLLAGATVRCVRGLTITSAVCMLAMLYSAYPGHRMLIGLAERALIGSEVAVLVVLAAALLHDGSRPAPPHRTTDIGGYGRPGLPTVATLRS
jgi:hypothetical protein